VSACGGSLVTASEDGTEALLAMTSAEIRRVVPWLQASSEGLMALAAQLRSLVPRLAAEPRRELSLPSCPIPAPCLMGILNVTPDSFSDGGTNATLGAAVSRANAIAEEGACLLDIGGESTRPGSLPVASGEELRRVEPVLQALAKDGYPLPVSLDTRRSTVAARSVELGVRILNDVSGLRDDPETARVAAANDCVLVLMHSRGTPDTMRQMAHYDDLLAEVSQELLASVEVALASGVPEGRIWLDPGIGFAKTLEQNLELLRRLPELHALGFPLLVGTSRKRFLGMLTGADDPQDRVEATLATSVLALQAGADVLRVHDVRANARALKVAQAVLGRASPGGAGA
jgi:dihydropteroate synthase